MFKSKLLTHAQIFSATVRSKSYLTCVDDQIRRETHACLIWTSKLRRLEIFKSLGNEGGACNVLFGSRL